MKEAFERLPTVFHFPFLIHSRQIAANQGPPEISGCGLPISTHSLPWLTEVGFSHERPDEVALVVKKCLSL